MKIKEIDMQNMATIRLSGTLDSKTVDIIAAKTERFFRQNCFKVVIDLHNVFIDNQGMISLAGFFDKLRANKSSITIKPADKNGFVKIELKKFPITFPLVGRINHYH
jgi:anti-anti-sigma regulatory factor